MSDTSDTSDMSDTGSATRPAPETPDVVIGNHHHKYSSKNPVIRKLTENWLGRLDDMAEEIARETPLAKRGGSRLR